MKRIQSFAVFEALVSDKSVKDQLSQEALDFLKKYTMGTTYSIYWKDDDINEAVLEGALSRAADEYLDSEDFREYTEERVREDDRHEEIIEEGDEDVIQEIVDKEVEDQTYWDDFLDGWILQDLIDEERSKITAHLNTEGYTENEADLYIRDRDGLKKISIYGSLVIHNYEESFFPPGIFIDDVHESDYPMIDDDYEMMEDFIPVGEFSMLDTKIVALDRGPRNIEGYYCRIEGNSRLISIEGIQSGLRSGGADLEIGENFLDNDTLMQSYELGPPGSEDSIEYYLGLIEHEKFPQFDEEQLLFTMERIGAENLQKRIDEDPAGMAVKIGKYMKVINSVKGMEGVKFPDDFSDEVEDFGDLKDLGF